MRHLSSRRLFGKAAWLALIAAAGACLYHLDAGAQEADAKKDGVKIAPAEKVKKAGLGPWEDEADREAGAATRGPRIVAAGYTWPGGPSDTLSEKGAIEQRKFKPDYKGMGGTIYFMVLELTGEDRDAWATGIHNFDSSFVPGVDLDPIKRSPGLDTRARFLYLYQLVNDRNVPDWHDYLGPDRTRPVLSDEAFLETLRRPTDTNPLASITLRLEVDPRYITSWGYFRGSSFDIEDPLLPSRGKEGAGGGIQPAKNKGGAGKVQPGNLEPIRDAQIKVAGLLLDQAAERQVKIAPVSADPAVLARFPTKLYSAYSPARPLPLHLQIGSSRLPDALPVRLRLEQGADKLKDFIKPAGLKNLEGLRPAQLVPEIIKPAAWVQHLNARPEGVPPRLVQLTYVRPTQTGEAAADLAGGAAPAEGRFEGGEWVLHIAWPTEATHVQPGQHSILFGFTSDLPPTRTSLVLADAKAAQAEGFLGTAAGLLREAAPLAAESAGATGGIRGAGLGGAAVGAADTGIASAANAFAARASAAIGAAVRGAADAVGGAVGLSDAITPAAAPPAAAPAAGGVGGVGGLGGLPPIGGGGLGFPGGFGAGGLGTAPPAAVTGGGGGNPGTGTGTGTTTPPTQQQTQAAQPRIVNLVNAVATATQAQSQSQSQKQAQQQQQQQSQTGGNGQVVPEPEAILLALLGLPILFLLCRRKKPGLAGA